MLLRGKMLPTMVHKEGDLRGRGDLLSGTCKVLGYLRGAISLCDSIMDIHIKGKAQTCMFPAKIRNQCPCSIIFLLIRPNISISNTTITGI